MRKCWASGELPQFSRRTSPLHDTALSSSRGTGLISACFHLASLSKRGKVVWVWETRPTTREAGQRGKDNLFILRTGEAHYLLIILTITLRYYPHSCYAGKELKAERGEAYCSSPRDQPEAGAGSKPRPLASQSCPGPTGKKKGP